MKKASVISNLFFSFLLQFTNMCFPLIISPYISAHLGIENIGKVNFSNSIVSWLLIFCVFGSDVYAVREVAKIRNDREKLSSFFSEIMSIKAILSISVFLIYIPSVIILPQFNNETCLFLVQGIQILLNILSMDWFFQGIENFRFITLRSIFMKTLSLFMVFLLIKNPQDYILYAFISIVALSMANILNINFIRKNIKLVRVSFSNLIIHIRKMSVFFVSSLIISIYSTFNQVLLGFLSDSVSVALFARAKQFFSLCLTLTNTISTTLLPRVTNYFTSNKEKYYEMLIISYNVIIMISIPMMVGLFFIAKPMMIFLGGSQFINSSIVLYIFSPLLIFIPLGTWNYNNRQLPMNLEYIALRGQLYMAIINTVLNFLLISKFQYIGAAISYLCTEAFGCFYGLFKTRKFDKSFTYINSTIFKVLISSSVMCIWLFYMVGQLSSIQSTVFMIVIGAIIYVICLVVLKEKNIKMFFSLFMKKIRRS